jgi:hypothetical protein
MSYVAFHFAEGKALHLRGMERAFLSHRVESLAIGAIGLTPGVFGRTEIVLEQIYPFLDEAFHRGRTPKDEGLQEVFARDLQNAIFERPLFSWKGRSIALWPLILNTAILAGSSPIRLAAKIHGTCEIHGRIEGPDRAWAADVIDEGLASKIYRKDFTTTKNPMAELLAGSKHADALTKDDMQPVFVSMGWTEIVEQLRASNQGAVVMSYSVTDDFLRPPKIWAPEGTPPEDPDEVYGWRWEEFENLPAEEQFRLSLEEVRETSGNASLSRETEMGLFQHELSLFDLIRQDVAKIEKCLKISPEEPE